MTDITIDSLFDGQLMVKQERLGYRFSIDAVILAYYAGRDRVSRVVDLGTGCGIIPLIMGFRNTANHIVGVEIQKSLTKLAIDNVQSSGMADRIDILLKDIKETTAVDVKGLADLVLSNPPFYKTNEGRINPNPQRAVARHELKVTISDIVTTAFQLLKEKGRFISIYQIERMVDLLAAMRQVGLEPKMLRIIHTKEYVPGKLFLVEGEKGGTPGISIPPPLIITMEDGNYSPEVAEMFLP